MNKFNRFIWHIRINTEWIKMGYMMTSNLFHSTHTQNCNFWRSQRWNLGMWTNTKQSKHMKYHLTNLDAINSCAIAYLVFCFFLHPEFNYFDGILIWFHSSRREPNNQLKDGCTTQRRKEIFFYQCFVVVVHV